MDGAPDGFTNPVSDGLNYGTDHGVDIDGGELEDDRNVYAMADEEPDIDEFDAPEPHDDGEAEYEYTGKVLDEMDEEEEKEIYEELHAIYGKKRRGDGRGYFFIVTLLALVGACAMSLIGDKTTALALTFAAFWGIVSFSNKLNGESK